MCWVGTQLGSPSSGSGTSPWDKPSTVVTPGVLARSGCPQPRLGCCLFSEFESFAFSTGQARMCVHMAADGVVVPVWQALPLLVRIPYFTWESSLWLSSNWPPMVLSILDQRLGPGPVFENWRQAIQAEEQATRSSRTKCPAQVPCELRGLLGCLSQDHRFPIDPPFFF